MPSNDNNSTIKSSYRELLGQFQKGEIESILFTTFNFSSTFFEDNVLPLIGNDEIDTELQLMPTQVNVSLEKTKVTVVCDRSTSPTPKGNYRYGLLTVGLPHGYFHPKIILATGTLKTGEQGAVLLVGSCNLTLSGWGINRETIGLTHVGQQQSKNILPLLEWLERAAKKNLDHIKTDAGSEINEEGATRNELVKIKIFLSEYCKKALKDEPKFYAKVPPLNNSDNSESFLSSLLPTSPKPFKTCQIVSPFWSEIKYLAPLLKAINSNSTVFVPSTNNDGQYKFPETMRKYVSEQNGNSSYQKFKGDDRYTHAKSVTLIDENNMYQLIGSANFTYAAMGAMSQGNVEAMLVYKLPLAKSYISQFTELVSPQWAECKDTEEAPPRSPYVVYAAYDWKENKLIYKIEPNDKGDKLSHISLVKFNNQALNYKAISKPLSQYIATSKPIYKIEIHYKKDEAQHVHTALVTQLNAEDEQLGYNPKPNLFKMLEQLRAIDSKTLRGGFKRDAFSEYERKSEQRSNFNYFNMFQAFYKLNKYFENNPDVNPYLTKSPNSLALLFTAIQVELEYSKNEDGSTQDEDLILLFIVFSELEVTCQRFPSKDENCVKLTKELEKLKYELEPSFINLIKNSSLLKQFLSIDEVDDTTSKVIYQWFKVQLEKNA